MTRATRVGLKVFDPLEIIEGNRIRRDLLLADKFAFDEAQLKEVRGYAEVVCTLHGKDPSQVLRKFDADWEHLGKLGLLDRVSMRNAKPSVEMQSEIDRLEQVASQCLEKKQFFKRILPDGRAVMIDPAGSYLMNRTCADIHRARSLAQQLSRENQHVIPFATGRIAKIFEKGSREAAVLRVVLSNLPHPDLNTPLDSIVAFKSDPDVASRLGRLRAWMVDMAVSPLSEEQIQTKLEAALEDYQTSMAHHKCKTAVSGVEFVVVTTAEVLENLARLRFSDVAKKLFQFFKEDWSLTDAELASPGRELAFIDSASQFLPKAAA